MLIASCQKSDNSTLNSTISVDNPSIEIPISQEPSSNSESPSIDNPSGEVSTSYDEPTSGEEISVNPPSIDSTVVSNIPSVTSTSEETSILPSTSVDNTSTSIEENDPSKAPTISVTIESIDIKLYESIMALDYVVAYDYQNNNITYKVDVFAPQGAVLHEDYSLTFNEAGNYSIEYSVLDYGNIAKAYLNVNVKAGVEAKDSHTPVFVGVKELTINPNKEVDLLSGITAYDDVDGDITNKVEIYINGEKVNRLYTFTSLEEEFTITKTVLLICKDAANNEAQASYTLVITTVHEIESYDLMESISKEYNCNIVTVANSEDKYNDSLTKSVVSTKEGSYANAIISCERYVNNLNGYTLRFKFKITNVKNNLLSVVPRVGGEDMVRLQIYNRKMQDTGLDIQKLSNNWYQATFVLGDLLNGFISDNALVVDYFRLSFTNEVNGSPCKVDISELTLSETQENDIIYRDEEYDINPDLDYAYTLKAAYNSEVSFTKAHVSPRRNSTFSAVAIIVAKNTSATYSGFKVGIPANANLKNKIIALDVKYDENSKKDFYIKTSWSDTTALTFNIEDGNGDGYNITSIDEEWYHIEIDAEIALGNLEQNYTKAEMLLLQFTNQGKNYNENGNVYVDNFNILSKDSEYVYEGDDLPGEGDDSMVTLSKAKITANEDNLISWSSVANADKYEIYVDNQLVDETSETSYQFNETLIGSYQIFVKSIDTTGGLKPSISNVLTVEVKPLSLAKATINKDANNLITWEEVENAESYEIYINDILITTISETNYQFNEVNDGNYFIYVVAKDSEEIYASSTSNTLRIIVGEVNSEDNDLTNSLVSMSNSLTVTRFNDNSYDGEYCVLLTETSTYQSVKLELSVDVLNDIDNQKVVFYVYQGEGYTNGYTKLGLQFLTINNAKMGTEGAVYYSFSASHNPALGTVTKMDNGWYKTEVNLSDLLNNVNKDEIHYLRIKLADAQACSIYLDSMSFMEK